MYIATAERYHWTQQMTDDQNDDAFMVELGAFWEAQAEVNKARADKSEREARTAAAYQRGRR